MLPDLRVRQRDYLLEIARAITEELEIEKVLALIVRTSSELLAGHAGLIALREEQVGWTIASTHGINPEFIKHLQPLLTDIPDQGDPARFELPEINRRLQRLTQAATMGFLSGVGLPLIARGEVLGVIFIFRSYRGRFSTEDRSLLQAFASQAATAVHNARLYSQVREQNQYLDGVLESSADGIFILDPAYRIQRWNRACARLTGYEPSSALGLPHNQLIRWKRMEPGLSFQEAEAGGWPLSEQATLYNEGQLFTRNGETIDVGITYAPTLSGDGKLLSIVAIMRDISKFVEADEIKSTFISIVSHELRTPVALIKGYAGTLRREDAQWDPEIVRDSLEVIEEEADRLSSLIDDLLDASRLQAGALALNRAEVALDRLAERAVRRFSPQNQSHSFHTEFPENFPVVIVDEQRLTQVMNNLLSNAVKYSPDGGDITIRGQVAADHLILCVHDQGPGIDPNDAPHIFDRFYRSSHAAKNTKGTGLGLYLARAIVEAHGGHIWVDDRNNQGATICFSIPRNEPENETE